MSFVSALSRIADLLELEVRRIQILPYIRDTPTSPCNCLICRSFVASSHVFIHNPTAGSHDHNVIEELRSTLGQRYKWLETTGPGEAHSLAVEAVKSGAST